MPWIAAAGAIAGGLISSRSADKAADAADAGAQDSIAYSREAEQQIRADSGPYRESGYNALNALNAMVGLPAVGTPDVYGGSSSQSLYGDGNTPLTREGLAQAYRDVLGREPDEGGLQHYLTRGPKSAGSGFVDSTGSPGAALGLDPGGLFKKEGERRSFTFNEFLNATLGSKEYKERTASGSLTAWDETRRNEVFNPTPEAPQGGSVGGAASPSEMVRSDPSYQFRLDEGMRAQERSAAARGGLLSGGALRKNERYAQDYASTEYQNIYNRISNIAGLGQVSTQGTNQAALQGGQIAAGAAGDAAYTRASAYTARGNAIGGAISDAALIYGQRNVPPPNDSGGYNWSSGHN